MAGRMQAGNTGGTNECAVLLWRVPPPDDVERRAFLVHMVCGVRRALHTGCGNR